MLNELIQYSNEDPQKGSECLAIHGSKTAAKHILGMLAKAPFTQATAPAWHWITGQQLVRKAILPSINAPTLPDCQQAQNWWDEHAPNWPNNERRIAGKKLSPLLVKELKLQWSGKASWLLMALANG